jgi:hypothetical protein
VRVTQLREPASFCIRIRPDGVRRSDGGVRRVFVCSYWDQVTRFDPRLAFSRLEAREQLPPQERLAYEIGYERFQLAQEVADLADRRGLSPDSIKQFLAASAEHRFRTKEKFKAGAKKDRELLAAIDRYSQFEIGVDDVDESSEFSPKKAMEYLLSLLEYQPREWEWWRLTFFLGRSELRILLDGRFWVLDGHRDDPKSRSEWREFWQVLLDCVLTMHFLKWDEPKIREWLTQSLKAALGDDENVVADFEDGVASLLAEVETKREKRARKEIIQDIRAWTALVKEVRATRKLSDEIELLRYETTQALAPYRAWFGRILQQLPTLRFSDKSSQQDFAVIAMQLLFIHVGLAEVAAVKTLAQWIQVVKQRKPVIDSRLKVLRGLTAAWYEHEMGDRKIDSGQLAELFDGAVNPLDRLRLLRDETLRVLEPYLSQFQDELKRSGGWEFSTVRDKQAFAELVNELLAINQKRLKAPTTGESARLAVVEKSPTNSHFRFSVSGAYRSGTPLVPTDLQITD